MGEARDLAGQWADAEGFPTEVIEDVRLVASELVTNAIAHAAGSAGVLLRLYRCEGGAVVEVWDADANKVPEIGEPDVVHESGRGLFIVNSLTGGMWGWQRLADNKGKATWARIPCTTTRT
ncbi:ATP-binding protein [Actinomadura flavalba]|uniref:ATP-binding protein n=1 Tax=Actinomadura flavalba TaxID=1120938 RepID=UPI0003A43FE7|nr:ATP-binding protein [Actinomadura flavalba]